MDESIMGGCMAGLQTFIALKLFSFFSKVGNRQIGPNADQYPPPYPHGVLVKRAVGVGRVGRVINMA